MSTKIKTGQISDIGTYVDAKDLTTLNAAKAYSDANDITKLAEAKAYTDGKDSTVRTDFATADTNLSNSLVSQIATAKGGAITSANGYTDAEITASENAMIISIDSKDSAQAIALTNLMTSKDATALNTANQNASYWDTLTLASAKSYADTLTGSQAFGALRFNDGYTDGVTSGSIAVHTSGLFADIPAQVVYVESIRNITIPITKLFIASVDTYVDINVSGAFVYTEVVNGAGAPAITGTNQRLFKVVTDTTLVTSIIDLRVMIGFYQNDAEILAAVQSTFNTKSTLGTDVNFDDLTLSGNIISTATDATMNIGASLAQYNEVWGKTFVSNGLLNIDARNAGMILFKVDSVTKVSLDTNAQLYPYATGAGTLGTTSRYWLAAYAMTVNTPKVASISTLTIESATGAIIDGGNGATLFKANAAVICQINSDNTFIPTVNNTGGLGTAIRTWLNAFIGTITAGTITTSGFTTLGTGGVGIKTKKLTGTTAAAEGGSVTVAHGLTMAKIISVDVLVNTGTILVPSDYVQTVGLQFQFNVGSTNITVFNHATLSENLLSKAFTVYITYEA